MTSLRRRLCWCKYRHEKLNQYPSCLFLPDEEIYPRDGFGDFCTGFTYHCCSASSNESCEVGWAIQLGCFRNPALIWCHE